MDIGSNDWMNMQNLQIPETAESRIVLKWLFPPRFSDKDRFTSSRPDIVLVTPISAKTRKQQTTVGGWVLRSGRGQLRETGSTPAAPPATSRATNRRQHRPKDLSKPRREILWEPVLGWLWGSCFMLSCEKKRKNDAGVITPQAWTRLTETELSDSEVLITLPELSCVSQ